MNKKKEETSNKNYVQQALKTESQNFEEVTQRLQSKKLIRLLHAALGISTEAGEILDALKKKVFYNKELDEVNLKEEMGDLFWYLAIMADTMNLDFEQAMETNLKKLKIRYGAKFSSERAISRNLEKEREILEKD